MSDLIAALQRELEGYRRAGKTDRAAQVQVELDRLTGTPRKPARPHRETTVAKRPVETRSKD